MNNVGLVGNFARDAELKVIPGGDKTVTSFTIAVDRPHTDKTDFINCIAWGKTAEFIGNYGTKGRKAELTGYITTSSWDKGDGTKGYRTDVTVEDFKFVDKKPAGDNQGGDNQFEPIDGEIPF